MLWQEDGRHLAFAWQCRFDSLPDTSSMSLTIGAGAAQLAPKRTDLFAENTNRIHTTCSSAEIERHYILWSERKIGPEPLNQPVRGSIPLRLTQATSPESPSIGSHGSGGGYSWARIPSVRHSSGAPSFFIDSGMRWLRVQIARAEQGEQQCENRHKLHDALPPFHRTWDCPRCPRRNRLFAGVDAPRGRYRAAAGSSASMRQLIPRRARWRPAPRVLPVARPDRRPGS